jgi:hypothetical protein
VFMELLDMVVPFVQKYTTVMRDAIPATQWLCNFAFSCNRTKLWGFEVPHCSRPWNSWEYNNSNVPGNNNNTTWQLQAIPKQAYQTCIEKWKDHWNRCIQSGGSYFEGDNFEQLVDAFVFLQ